MTENHSKRIAVIENELSQGLDIESLIVKSGVSGSPIDGFFQLNNGCICCSVKDNLLATLEQLAKHPDKFDYIVIEMTGVANPGPVISSFWIDEGLQSVLKLDGVVCVVDGFNFESQLQSSDISQDVKMQICYADRILLNKCDLISSKQADKIELMIKDFNNLSEIRRTSFQSNVSVDFILDIDGYATNADTVSTRGIFDEVLCQPCNKVNNDNESKHIASTLGTEAITFSGYVSIREFEKFIDEILYQNGDIQSGDSTKHHSTLEKDDQTMRIFRMKGIIHVKNEKNLFIFQGVHDTFEIKPSNIISGSKDDGTKQQNQIIVIGKYINPDILLRGFLACSSSL